MNLEPFYALLPTQTLFHSEQATGCAKSFQVKFVAITGRDNKSN